MKLFRYSLQGQSHVGVLPAGQTSHFADLASLVTDVPDDITALFDPALRARVEQSLAKTPTAALQPLAGLPFEVPLAHPPKIVCMGLNYADHAKEGGNARPEYPSFFMRAATSMTPHNGPIVRPKVSESLDWEGELAVIIGQGGRNIPESQALQHVAGYSCYNDGSVREWQFHAKQIAAGKNFESTGGFGPWMVTADEIDPQRKLKLEVRLNGEVVQSGDTGQMIFSVAKLIAYASTIFTLVPGDVIITGTPSGVGFSRKPPRFMKAGDVCEVEIEGVGVLRNPIVDQV